MDTLWKKIFENSNQEFVGRNKLVDVYNVMTVDLSYVLRKNPNTGEQNVVDELTREQRLSHPKFIHQKGLVAKFNYVPYNTQSNKSQLCDEKMSGILRFGPANKCQINMLSFAFKFWHALSTSTSTENESLYNMLLTGGSAKNIDPLNPPCIGNSEVPYYATDISFIDTTLNKGANFLSKSFSDLVENQNALDVSEFVPDPKYRIVYFKLNPLIMRDFDQIKHDPNILENMEKAINKHMKKTWSVIRDQDQDKDQDQDQDQEDDRYNLSDHYESFELGYFYALANNTEIKLGTIFLTTPVIRSLYADKFLFFQHNLANVKPVKGTVPKNHDNLNTNPKKCECVFARRLGYFIAS